MYALRRFEGRRRSAAGLGASPLAVDPANVLVRTVAESKERLALAVILGGLILWGVGLVVFKNKKRPDIWR